MDFLAMEALIEKLVTYLVVTIFIVAIIAGVFGFTGIAAGAVEIGKILFFLFIVLFLVSLLFGSLRRP